MLTAAAGDLPDEFELAVALLNGVVQITTYGGARDPFVRCVDVIGRDGDTVNVRRNVTTRAPLGGIVIPVTFGALTE